MTAKHRDTPRDPPTTATTPLATETPGPLRNEVWLTLQTRPAQLIFSGRLATPEKPHILGVTRFGAILSHIKVCVYADDPYADWWLIKVEEALAQASAEIKSLCTSMQNRLKPTPAVEIAIAESLHPLRVPLQFRNPYAYQVGFILAEFDTLVRGVLTARHVGLMDQREAERCIATGGRALRRTLGTACGYKFLGVKRTDIAEGNAKAQLARERMGEVPPEVLDGTRRARFAPERRPGERPKDTLDFTRPKGLISGWNTPAKTP
jgi:integrating conjugative element protein (TIGR03761 family)